MDLARQPVALLGGGQLFHLGGVFAQLAIGGAQLGRQALPLGPRDPLVEGHFGEYRHEHHARQDHRQTIERDRHASHRVEDQPSRQQNQSIGQQNQTAREHLPGLAHQWEDDDRNEAVVAGQIQNGRRQWKLHRKVQPPDPAGRLATAPIIALYSDQAVSHSQQDQGGQGARAGPITDEPRHRRGIAGDKRNDEGQQTGQPVAAGAGGGAGGRGRWRGLRLHAAIVTAMRVRMPTARVACSGSDGPNWCQ